MLSSCLPHPTQTHTSLPLFAGLHTHAQLCSAAMHRVRLSFAGAVSVWCQADPPLPFVFRPAGHGRLTLRSGKCLHATPPLCLRTRHKCGLLACKVLRLPDGRRVRIRAHAAITKLPKPSPSLPMPVGRRASSQIAHCRPRLALCRLHASNPLSCAAVVRSSSGRSHLSQR